MRTQPQFLRVKDLVFRRTSADIEKVIIHGRNDDITLNERMVGVVIFVGDLGIPDEEPINLRGFGNHCATIEEEAPARKSNLMKQDLLERRHFS